jgi:Tfp pilus assembly protein PilN
MHYNMVDINSPQYKQDQQRMQSLRTQVVLWLIVLALGVVIIPLMLITGWVRNDLSRLEGELLRVQSAMSDATSPSEEVVKINSDIGRINQLVTSMQTVTIPSSVNWPVIVDAVEQYDPATIDITSLTQAPDKIEITGRAVSSDAVVRYQQLLLDSRAFNDVIVVSMSTVPPTPVPTPADESAAETPTSDSAAGRVADRVEFVIDLVVGKTTP